MDQKFGRWKFVRNVHSQVSWIHKFVCNCTYACTEMRVHMNDHLQTHMPEYMFTDAIGALSFTSLSDQNNLESSALILKKHIEDGQLFQNSQKQDQDEQNRAGCCLGLGRVLRETVPHVILFVTLIQVVISARDAVLGEQLILDESGSGSGNIGRELVGPGTEYRRMLSFNYMEWREFVLADASSCKDGGGPEQGSPCSNGRLDTESEQKQFFSNLLRCDKENSGDMTFKTFSRYKTLCWHESLLRAKKEDSLEENPVLFGKKTLAGVFPCKTFFTHRFSWQ